jgi:hypothetical protein
MQNSDINHEKKITIIPGVGLFNDTIPDRYLFKLIEKELPEYDFTWFNWQHALKIPDTNLPYKKLRKLTLIILRLYMAYLSIIVMIWYAN